MGARREHNFHNMTRQRMRPRLFQVAQCPVNKQIPVVLDTRNTNHRLDFAPLTPLPPRIERHFFRGWRSSCLISKVLKQVSCCCSRTCSLPAAWPCLVDFGTGRQRVHVNRCASSAEFLSVVEIFKVKASVLQCPVIL